MKRGLRTAFQILSLLLFAIIIWWAGEDAATAVLQGDRQSLLLALLLYGVAGVASASRLRVVTHGIHKEKVASWRQYFQVNWVARAFGLVLPRTLSAVGGKSVGLHAFGVPVKRSLWIVLVDNLFDVFLLALACLPAFLYFQGQLSGVGFVTALLLVVIVAGTAVYWGTSAKWAMRLTKWAQRIPYLSRKLNIEEEQRVIVLPPSRQALIAFGWTVLLNLVLIGGFYLMARAVGVSANWLLFAAAYPFVQLSLIAAVTPGGLGIFDLGWLGLLVLGGVSEADALAFVVAQRVYVAAFVLFWTGFSILLRLTERLKSN